jgi:ribose transport system permease protein
LPSISDECIDDTDEAVWRHVVVDASWQQSLSLDGDADRRCRGGPDLYPQLHRGPGIVWTLAVNAMLLGATVSYTSGFKPQGAVPPLALYAAQERVFGIPIAFLVWAAVGVLTMWMLKRTVYGTYIFAMGNSQRALFMAGAGVRRVTIATLMVAGMLSSLGGILLTGYATRPIRAWAIPI